MLADRLARVRERIHEACVAAGRDPSSVELVAVSKTFGTELIRSAASLGQVHFGESYAQELRDKARELDLPLHWHFIGRLQTNKAKYVAPVAYRVHALETVEQAQALAKRLPDGRTLKCLLSVHLGPEASKGGVPPEQALERCDELGAVGGIEIVGLMTLPPYEADPARVAPWFEQLAQLAETGRRRGLALHELSMGMSHDFEVAIQCGATWVRVGTAIFGDRT